MEVVISTDAVLTLVVFFGFNLGVILLVRLYDFVRDFDRRERDYYRREWEKYRSVPVDDERGASCRKSSRR